MPAAAEVRGLGPHGPRGWVQYRQQEIIIMTEQTEQVYGATVRIVKEIAVLVTASSLAEADRKVAELAERLREDAEKAPHRADLENETALTWRASVSWEDLEVEA